MTNTTASPRRLLQPRKEVLRSALRDAADKIESQAREIEQWKTLADAYPQARHVFFAGMAVGALLCILVRLVSP